MEQRPLTIWERSVVNALLAPSFPGVSALREQVNGCSVAEIDTNGSIKFHCVDAPIARVMKRVPVEATAIDDDGVNINYLIHVVDGMLDELEVYKDDGTPILNRGTSAFDVVVLPES